MVSEACVPHINDLEEQFFVQLNLHIFPFQNIHIDLLFFLFLFFCDWLAIFLLHFFISLDFDFLLHAALLFLHLRN